MTTDLRDRLVQVAYGAGVNSTAMLIGLYRMGIRPDRILFADTGGENPETYAYLPVIQRWLASLGVPPGHHRPAGWPVRDPGRGLPGPRHAAVAGVRAQVLLSEVEAGPAERLLQERVARGRPCMRHGGADRQADRV